MTTEPKIISAADARRLVANSETVYNRRYELHTIDNELIQKVE